MSVIDGALRIKHFYNDHGVVLRIIGHGNGDVVVMASGHGSVARYDGAERAGTVGDSARMGWEAWVERVMDLLANIRRA